MKGQGAAILPLLAVIVIFLLAGRGAMRKGKKRRKQQRSREGSDWSTTQAGQQDHLNKERERNGG